MTPFGGQRFNSELGAVLFCGCLSIGALVPFWMGDYTVDRQKAGRRCLFANEAQHHSRVEAARQI
jgi:hypothetical protein